MKILYWDRDGLAVWSKRLEEGTYAVPFEDGARERQREITAQELGALLSGIDLSVAKRRKRFFTWKRAAFRVIWMHGGHRSEQLAPGLTDTAEDYR